MKTYGLIGKRLAHSFSPAYFEKKFETFGIKAQYLLFELDNVREVRQLIENHPELAGLNVTIPYKEDIMNVADEADPVARIVGAVNTLKIERTGEGAVIRGFNTDVVGFEKTLLPFIEGRNDLSALVLGTGGAARAVVYVLDKLNIPFKYVSRTPDSDRLGYADLTSEIIKGHRLIINTTPVGMYPEVEKKPEIPFQYLTPEHILYDLIYKPSETLFLKKGREKGCVTMNGRRMLELQADASWEIWCD